MGSNNENAVTLRQNVATSTTTLHIDSTNPMIAEERFHAQRQTISRGPLRCHSVSVGTRCTVGRSVQFTARRVGGQAGIVEPTPAVLRVKVEREVAGLEVL